MSRSLSLIALCLMLGAASAQSPPPELMARAQALPAATRAELRQRAETLAAMTPAQRQAFRRRVAQWDALTPAQQRQRREIWQAWQALPAAERDRVRAAARAYATLPDDRRQALRAKYDALDGSDKRGWLLGPELGADYPGLHALIAQIPAAQRMPMLVALRALSPRARDNLAILSQRTPPQHRDALRTQLLAVPARERDDWLRTRLQR